jgi:hypothetical protein
MIKKNAYDIFVNKLKVFENFLQDLDLDLAIVSIIQDIIDNVKGMYSSILQARQIISQASLTHPTLCRPREPDCHPRRTSSPTRKSRHKSSVAEPHCEQQNQTPTEPTPAGAPQPSSLMRP